MTMQHALTAGGYLAAAARRRISAMQQERVYLDHLRRQADKAAQAYDEPAFVQFCREMDAVVERIGKLDAERIEFVKAVYLLRSRFE